MTAQSNLKKDILVLNMEQQLEEVAMEMYDKDLAALTDQETYYVVLVYTKRLMEVSDRNEGEKKIYYISAEFLIGKLLSNNLINLGVYDKIDSILKRLSRNRLWETAVWEDLQHASWIPLQPLDFPVKESDLIITMVFLNRYLRTDCRQQRRMTGSKRIPG